MPDNLTVQISADSSKLRADLTIAEARLRNFRRELTAAGKEAEKTGDPSRVRALSVQYEVQAKAVADLRRQYGLLGGTVAATGSQMAISARSFRSLEGAVMSVAKSFGGLRAGLIGFGATIAAQGFGKLIGSVVEDLSKLQQVASNTNLSPAQVKAYQEAMLRAGLSVDQANSSLATFAKVVTDARLQAGTFGGNTLVQVQRGTDAASSGVVRLAGDTAQFIQVWRGGQPLKDLSDPLKQLGVDVNNLSGGFLGLRIRAAEALQAMQKVSPERAAGLGQLVFGPDWQKEVQAIIASAAALKAATGAVISPEDQARLDAYNKAWGDLSIAWTNLATSAVLAFFPSLTFLIKTATDELNAFVAVANNLPAIWQNLSTAKTLLSNPEAAIAGMATGGMVRGPGGPTSDSILARLSNGEFVMSAGAVQRWGAGLLASMNGGGTLIPRNGKYAAGGLVTAGGGAPVHLHLGGQSFALAGNQSVVNALVIEAHRHRIRSTGTKPSWFGGTPSGR